MSKHVSVCQLTDRDGAPLSPREVGEPSHIHVARPSRRRTDTQRDVLPLLGDAALDDDAAAA
jgi:hypothetical protein